jgi:hypothetical protein
MIVEMSEKIEAETEAPPPPEGEVADTDAEAQASVAEDGEVDAGEEVDGEVEGDEADEEPISDLIEQAGRAAGLLAFREAQLSATRHAPEVRRAILDVAIALGIVLAFLTAFALANWAAVSALSGPLPSWAAPLVVAGAWILIGILLLVFVMNRGDRVFGWRQLRMLGADSEQKIIEREKARDEAQQGMRDSLERLAGGVGSQAAVLVSAAVIPVAGGVVEAGEDILDGIDEFTDDIAEAMPGGGVINWVADVALIPGRYVARVARSTIKGSAKS